MDTEILLVVVVVVVVVTIELVYTVTCFSGT